MSYLEEFQSKINKRDFHKFFILWEEYCTNDQVDAEEFIQLLEMVKASDFAEPFGQLVDTAVPLYNMIQDKEQAYNVAKLLLDLQTSNSNVLADIAINILSERYPEDPEFENRLRLIGLRDKLNFKGAISNYHLLAHLAKGHFVFHIAGWGVGEILDVSPIRQQVSLELEHVMGIKYLTFENAFKTLIPLQKEHFLVRRFADPDAFEEYALKHPLDTVIMLLRDLGPKTAAEIKDELEVLVIPETQWSRWWQRARQQIKRSTEIFVPTNIQSPFYIREEELSHEKRLRAVLDSSQSLDQFFQSVYSFMREVPQALKSAEIQNVIKDKMMTKLEDPVLSLEQRLGIYIFLDEVLGLEEQKEQLKAFIREMDDVEKVIQNINIISSTKRALEIVRKERSDWSTIFIRLLFSLTHGMLREYLFKELQDTDESKNILDQRFERLRLHPMENPDLFFWVFKRIFKEAQKLSSKNEMSDSEKEVIWHYFEGYLILLQKLEQSGEYKDLLKKMVQLLLAKRYENIRILLDLSSEFFAREFLLLAAKCYTFSPQDQKIFRNLVHVVYPEINEGVELDKEEEFVWMTAEGRQQQHDRMEKIATTEIVENAKEVEAARALGDLRENAEYKYAVEKRKSLQNELKSISKQYAIARIITEDDVSQESVGIGNVVELTTSKGEKKQYTLLGPIESDPDKGIISYQSHLAQSMWGLKQGESFTFGEESYKINTIKSFFDK